MGTKTLKVGQEVLLRKDTNVRKGKVIDVSFLRNYQSDLPEVVGVEFHTENKKFTALFIGNDREGVAVDCLCGLFYVGPKEGWIQSYPGCQGGMLDSWELMGTS